MGAVYAVRLMAVLFVYGAVDGDIADVITRQRRSYLEGVIKTLIEPCRIDKYRLCCICC